MKFHQVISTSPQKIKCRDISCVCLQEQGKFDCPCFDLKNVELVVEGRTAVCDPIVEDGFAGMPTQETTSYQIGSWCVLLYDEIAYPGKILDTRNDGDVQVSCLHKIGKNRFQWPKPRLDIDWYSKNELLCPMPTPD